MGGRERGKGRGRGKAGRGPVVIGGDWRPYVQ